MRQGFARTLARASCCATIGLAVQLFVPAARAEVATALGSPGSSASVRVESSGVACPSAEQVETALRHGGVSAASATTGWVLSYGNASFGDAARQGASVWMDLASPSGQLVAQRQFPNDGSDCGAIASAMSAVVDRSLHELGWTRGEALPESPRSVKPESAPVSHAPPPRPPRLIVGMGPAVGTSARVGVNLLLDARLQVVGPMSLRLGAGLMAGDDSQAVAGGRARMTSRHVSAAVLSTLPRGRAHLDAGAVFLVSIDQGTTENLAVSAEGRRAALAAGLVLGAGVGLSRRWRLALDIQGLRAVAGADFVVDFDSGRKPVLPPPTWQGIVCAKLEFVAWP